MGLLAEIKQMAKEDARVFFKPLICHPILMISGSLLVGAALTAYRFGTLSHEHPSDIKGEVGGAEQIRDNEIPLPNLETLPE